MARWQSYLSASHSISFQSQFVMDVGVRLCAISPAVRLALADTVSLNIENGKKISKKERRMCTLCRFKKYPNEKLTEGP